MEFYFSTICLKTKRNMGNSFYPFFIISFRETWISFFNCYSNNLWEHPSPIHYLHFILFTLSQLLNLRILTNKIKNSKGSVLKSFSSRYSFLSQCMARNSFHVLLASPHVMRYGLPLYIYKIPRHNTFRLILSCIVPGILYKQFSRFFSSQDLHDPCNLVS
jgi:hypothetical protein